MYWNKQRVHKRTVNDEKIVVFVINRFAATYRVSHQPASITTGFRKRLIATD